MKAIVHIEINDDDRDHLANLIDGKVSKRKVTRAEVVALCQQHIGGLLGAADPSVMDDRTSNDLPQPTEYRAALMIPDPDDIPMMAQPNNPSYVRGWNQVKRGAS